MATKKKEPTYITCVTCDRELSADRNFYINLDKSDSTRYNQKVFHGRIPFCRDCIRKGFADYYEEYRDIKIAILATCSAYNIPFSTKNMPTYNPSNIRTTDDAIDVFNSFIKTNLSIGKKNLSSNTFDIMPHLDKTYKEDTDEDKMYLEDDLDLEIDTKVIRFFGSGFSERDYKLMLAEYLELVRNFGSGDYDKITYFKDISYLNVLIANSKAKGLNPEDIIKLIEKRNAIMLKAGLTKDDKGKQDSHFYLGQLIKQMENNRPAADDEWDNNQMQEISTIIAGHLMKVEGKTGKIRDDYEKIMDKYTVTGIDDASLEGGGEEDDE